VTDSYAIFSAFYTGFAAFPFKQLLNCTNKAELTPFQTHYFLENVIAPGIEPGFVARNSDL
jgi:hypothetical protein